MAAATSSAPSVHGRHPDLAGASRSRRESSLPRPISAPSEVSTSPPLRPTVAWERAMGGRPRPPLRCDPGVPVGPPLERTLQRHTARG